MASVTTTPSRPTGSGPAWAIAELFPQQGQWSDEDYLVLNRLTNHFVELSDGSVEVPAMPTISHQRIVICLQQLLAAFVDPRRLGEVVTSPYPVRLWEGKFREPDLLFVRDSRRSRLGEDYADGADLVLEVVSGDRARDLVIKRREYARAHIPEYWIVDPQEHRITVLRLEGDVYVVHADATARQRATSALLEGFEVEVDAVMARGTQGRGEDTIGPHSPLPQR
jgi:Uma2 family endonuclease